MSEIIEIKSTEQFDNEINGEVLTLVDFFATWCNPCRLQGPILQDLNLELNGKIKILKVNVDDNEKIAAKYGIMSIPTIILFKSGAIKEKNIGLIQKEQLLDLIKKHI